MLTIYQDKGRRVERNELPSIVTTPRGDRSRRWQCIAHAALVDGIERVLTDNLGYEIKSTELVLSGGKADRQSCLVGGFELGRYGGLGQDVEMCLGWIHDNAGSRSISIYAGGSVGICANGLAFGQDSSRRKHTTGLRLYPYLCERLARVPELFQETQQRLDQLVEKQVQPRDHERLMISAARRNVLSWSALGKVDEAWTQAARGVDVSWEKADRKGDWPFRGNAWDWMNAVTHILKTQSPLNQVAKMRRIENGLHAFATGA
jgi:hypothetical protein